MSGAPTAAAPAGAGAAPGAEQTARASSLHARADAATEALVARFWNGGGGRLRARLALHGRAVVAAQDRRGWTRDWLDDQAWMAVALLRAYDATGDRGLLDRAAALVDDVFRGAPDASCCGADAGGLWWDRPHTQKATASR